MKTIHLGVSLLLFYYGHSQVVIDVDKNRDPVTNRVFYSAGGYPVSTAKYVRIVSGTPYFSETWMKGDLLINDSTECDNVLLRLDLLDGTISYLTAKNEEMISVMPVKAVTLNDTLTGNNYLFVSSAAIPGTPVNEKTWYQLLAGEKVVLYKQYYKRLMETKAYASSITEETIQTEARYFIGMNDKFIRVKKPNDMAEMVSKNKQALLDYIQQNKLTGKKEADFISAVKFYDTLK